MSSVKSPEPPIARLLEWQPAPPGMWNGTFELRGQFTMEMGGLVVHRVRLWVDLPNREVRFLMPSRTYAQGAPIVGFTDAESRLACRAALIAALQELDPSILEGDAEKAANAA